MRHWPKAAALAAALVCVVSCGPRGTPRTCRADADCSSGSYCAQGVCTDMRADDCRRVSCSVSIVAPSSMAFTEGALAVQVSVSGTVPDTVELLRDGAQLALLTPPYQYTWDTSAEAEGTHELTARAAQGPTVFTSEPREVVVSRTPGTVAISTPDSTIFTNGRVTFQLTVSGVPPDKVELLKDGSSLATLQPPYEYTWDTAGEPEGTYQFVARAARGAASFSSEPRTVVVSRAARAVAISTPSTTAFTNGRVEFRLIFSGPAPDEVELLEDGSVLAVLGAPYEYTWDTAGEPEGGHPFVARATQGGTSYSSEPRSVVIDRTPPTVVAQSPAPGDTNVALRAPIYVQFSEPVRLPAGAPASVVALTGAGGAALSANVALSTDQQRLLVSYVLDPTVPSDVALSLQPGITDRAGNPLTIPAAWGWHMPTWQRLGAYVTQAPSITGFDLALDASGRPTVAWGEPGALSVARWNGDGWEVIGSGIHGPGSTPARPMVALRPSGEPVLAWSENTSPGPGTSNQVIVKHRTSAGWEYLGQNPIGPPGTGHSDLAIDTGGGIWLGTSELGTQTTHAIVRKYDGALYWTEQGGSLNRAERNANGPKFAFDSSGALWAAWTESAGFGGVDNYLVYELFTSKLEAGSWKRVGGALNDNGSAPVWNFRLAAGPGGYPVVTWNERIGSFKYNAWYRVAGIAGWSSQLPAAYSSSGTPPMACTTGYLYAAASFAPYYVYRSLAGQGGWLPVGTEEFRVNPSVSASAAVIRSTLSGEVVLAWSEADGSTWALYVKKLNR